jgi:hypothetical protein
MPISMAASPAPDKVAAGSEENGPTSPAGGGNLRAIAVVLMAAAVAAAAPTLLLVRFHGEPMSQVWTVSLSVCAYVFVFLQCIWRPSRSFYHDFVWLSYGPMFACCSARAIGPATAVFVLLFGMAWAAGTLGYSLAVHRLRNVEILGLFI